MAETAGFAVAKVCEAQELLRKAGALLIEARLQTVRMSGGNEDDFRGTPLERRMDSAAAAIGCKAANDLDPMIRDLAALIPPSEEPSNA